MNNITDDPKAVTKFACRSNPGCNQAVTYATGTGGQAAGYIQRQGDAPRRGVARTGWTGLALSGDRAPKYKSKLIRPTSGPNTFNDYCSKGRSQSQLAKSGDKRWCVDFYPVPTMCPKTVGTPVTGVWKNRNGGDGVAETDPDNLHIICGYDAIDPVKMFSDQTMNDVFDTTTTAQIRCEFCSKPENIDSLTCRNFFADSRTGVNWFTVKLGLCGAKNWGADPTCVNAVNDIFKTTDSVNSVNRSTAGAMTDLYCQDKTKPACACYNVSKRTTDQILAEPNTTAGVKNIKDKVGKYKSLGATFLTAQIKPFCASDECKVAQQSTSGTIISQPGPRDGCNDKINACFSQISIGQMQGGNLNAGCTIQDLSSSPPAAAPKTTPTAPKTTPPPAAASKTTDAAPKTTDAAPKTTDAAPKTTDAASKTTPTASKTTPAASKTTPPATASGSTSDSGGSILIFIIICICCLMCASGVAYFALKT